MQLQQMENELLNDTQQTELVNFGGAPNFAGSTNPTLNKNLIDYYINRGYIRTAKDLADIELFSFEVTIASVSAQIAYSLTPPGGGTNPPFHQIQRIFYTAIGQAFTLEMEPGIRLLPWKEFQRWTQAGYFQVTGQGATIPNVCSVTPDRQELVFFPAPQNNGDQIEINYAPVPTAGTLVPLLSAPTDAPLVPDECDKLILLDAIQPLWKRLREFGAVKEAEAERKDLLAEIKRDCLKRTRGDKLQITDARDDFATSGPYTLPFAGW